MFIHKLMYSDYNQNTDKLSVNKNKLNLKR